MKTITYSVTFSVYHYNNGMGDNGTRSHTIDCDSITEAIEIKDKIDHAFELDCNDINVPITDEKYAWVREYIMNSTANDGFLKTNATIYKITRTLAKF